MTNPATVTSRVKRPTSERAKPRLGWVIALTSAAYFMVVLDSVVVITALPRMHRDLHVGVSSLQWTVTAYGIAFAAGIITAAALGDRFGRRRVFSGGLALFTLASAACALAPNMAELIAARTVQGLGAAAVLPLSLTILTTVFRPERRGMIVGVYGGLAGLAVALGPLVGGAITEAIDWHWIFWINVPIGLAAVVLGRRLLPESHGAPERLDLIGVSLFTAGVVALVWALTRASDVGWTREMGKASGINFMAQRFGTVFAIAIASAVFSANGHLGSPASVTAGFRPALWACAAFAVLAALTAFGISPRRTRAVAPVKIADLPVAA